MYNLSVKTGNFGDGRQIAQERAQILELKVQECLEFDVCVCVCVCVYFCLCLRRAVCMALESDTYEWQSYFATY